MSRTLISCQPVLANLENFQGSVEPFGWAVCPDRGDAAWWADLLGIIVSVPPSSHLLSPPLWRESSCAIMAGASEVQCCPLVGAGASGSFLFLFGPEINAEDPHLQVLIVPQWLRLLQASQTHSSSDSASFAQNWGSCSSQNWGSCSAQGLRREGNLIGLPFRSALLLTTESAYTTRFFLCYSALGHPPGPMPRPGQWPRDEG